MKGKNKSKKNQELIDSYDYLSNSASANDCTGLIPSAPQSEEELQSYMDVYQYTAPGTGRKHTGSSSDIS